jgi:hypothetical protein
VAVSLHAVGALAAVAQHCGEARRAAVGSLDGMCGGLVEVALNSADALRCAVRGAVTWIRILRKVPCNTVCLDIRLIH